MQNFDYHNPTRLVFGKGTLARIRDLVAPEARILMTYGGGSIKRNGVYDQVRTALEDRTWFEFGGIEPNPCYETLMRATALAREKNVDFLLAVGGGSVLDGTKFVAAAIPFSDGDPWQLLNGGASVRSAVPLGCVLTLPATGSEMNGFAVISRTSTREKLAFGDERLFPRFSVLDPETTLSLPAAQVRNGIVDAFVHVFEQYLTPRTGTALQDRQAEAILNTLVETGPRTLKDAGDLEARATFMWCATQALNGLIGCGAPQDWATHMIGHELTALYGLAHAETLAAVVPHLLRYRAELKQARLVQYGQRVWDLGSDRDPADLAEAAIARTETFFEALGMPTSLEAHGIDPGEAAPRVRDRLAGRGMTALGEAPHLTPDDAAAILRRSVTAAS
jgi:NADP-dependent alcohol dehydrogenase